MRGFLLIDKEKGMTSFDVVRAVRRATGERRVGHAGTLDPLATGLLLVAVGEATKLLEYFIGCDKEYEVRARFGFVSDTFDAEGRVSAANPDLILQKEDLELAMKSFLGDISQVPPKYSALKICGKKAYDLARKGEDFDIKARKVKIEVFEILKFDWPVVDFKVKCGSGTYIRSLIHDLGQVLRCGAYVEELCRIRVGNFSLKDAVKLESLNNKFEQFMLSVEAVVAGFFRFDLTDTDFEGANDGRVLLGKKVEHQAPVMAFYKDKVVGVLKNCDDGMKYAKVLHY